MSRSEPESGNPYRPIVIGFVLLSVPLWIAGLFLSESGAGRWANLSGAVVMVACAALLGRSGSR